ncbi:conserved hypothetical protein [Talaromyces stipitatus ATCC 10500]|uniref:Uncharacterized protein n=1 Tax=Talaromyces stipitatus (strain ATCC 10500 / CBS 375.48 / QM 6759 / NRRL 1006) TaxID=441959 RepID=B8M090_TALSN|nr:uncharacterized protein TSTA_084180 [Talaromyces stipitatus ATCC 10500]EED21187.1 conserved hypothetical protein [Talaromyces stipitatus ATCC 10500]
MARATKRRKASGRSKKVLDYLNNMSANQDVDDDDTHAINKQNMQAESADHDDAENDHITGRDSDQRRTRRSARLNKGKAGEVTPVIEENNTQNSDSSIFVSQEANIEVQDDEGGDEEAEEADEAEEGEAEREPEEDGESISSEDDIPISGPKYQLQLEQEQAIVSRIASPFAVIINGEKDRTRNRKTSIPGAMENESPPAEINHVDNSAELNDIEDAESQQEEDDYNEYASDENPNVDESEDDMGSAMRGLFDWDAEQPPEPAQRTRIVDRLQPQPPETGKLATRKRKRVSNTTADGPESRRRRRESRNENIEIAVSGALPVASASTAAGDWEAGVSEDEARDEAAVVVQHTAYDEATKIKDLQRSWKRLMQNCEELRATESYETRKYVRLEAIEERISDLIKDYKRIQKRRSRGRAIDPNAWEHTEEEVKGIGKDADKIRKVAQMRAEEGKEKNDLELQVDVVDYAKLIYKDVMTGLSELALECLKAYYSEEDEWLLAGGFTAVLNILEIAGRINTTLTSLHNCGLVVLSPDPGRHIRIELRLIQQSLADAEACRDRKLLTTSS